MSNEDYLQYYIQGSDHYLIPKDIFDELFTETKNWKKEARQYKEVINKAINKLKEDISFCKKDSQGLYDICNSAILREQRILDILREVEHEKSNY